LLANTTGYRYNHLVIILFGKPGSYSVPVSKKRKKKRIKPSSPPLPKSELGVKKKKLTRQQILIYIFSALVILSLAAGFVISSVGQQPVQPALDQNMLILTPTVQSEESQPETEATTETTPESESEN
jgi:hypothetical protein